jgi:SPP1 gp7 family putative phage head morphogenesis protein
MKMSRDTDNYWLDRAKSRLTTTEKIGLNTIKDILPIYDRAYQNVQDAIDSLYKNYGKKIGIVPDDLRAILSSAERSDWLSIMEKKIRALGMNPEDVYSNRYLDRLTRLEAFEQQVLWEIRSITPEELAKSENGYREIITKAYEMGKEDVIEGLGFEGVKTFASIDSETMNEILYSRWQGGNYSTRIWANNSIMQERSQHVIRDILGGGLTTGVPISQMRNQLMERFDVGKYNATRLVRTETNYFQTQSTLRSYEDEGVKYYEFVAIMDGRTSDICEALDGKVIAMKDVVEGFNAPPLHPNCRSAIKLLFEQEAEKRGVASKTEVRKIYKDLEED